MIRQLRWFGLGLLLLQGVTLQAQTFTFDDDETPAKVGRGKAMAQGGVLTTQTAFVSMGENTLKDYSFTFRARNPEHAEQVQIWAGFRMANRYDRYVVGIKGGLLDQVYLMRMGYMGTDEFMGERPLRFHPVPGQWYRLRVEVVGQRIRVFVGDEPLPYIDVTDKNGHLAAQGPVTLGGGWIETEYDDLTITPLPSDALAGVSDREYSKLTSKAEKERLRQMQREAYQPVRVDRLNKNRTVVSLDGNWLFMPEFERLTTNAAEQLPESPATTDADWHVMNVPDFWNPIRIWLHGETMPSPRGHQPKGVSDAYYQKETDRCAAYTFDYEKVKAAWYRQWVHLPNDIKGKQLTLHFDAVSKMAEVYVNGHLAGSHVGMFADFDFDVSPYMKPGHNLIAVKVTRNRDDDSNAKNDRLDAHYALAQGNETRETTEQRIDSDLLRDLPHGFFGNDPAGIWQPVELVITNKVKIEDVFIKPSMTGADVELTVKNHGNRKSRFAVNVSIVDHQTGQSLYSGTLLSAVTLKGDETQTLTSRLTNLSPKLWSPQHPNLYDFHFSLVDGDRFESDACKVISGFRTFEVKDGLFYLNGVKYWLRGANQPPSAICPNDDALAHRFYQLMKEGNIEVTRTHTAPFNELWMKAADEEGIAVSFEGTWPWLMLENQPIPGDELMQLWKDEMLQLMRKYRNHPSLILWTVNNEMKFYDLDRDHNRAMKKMVVISDLVKQMRQVDPTRPMVYDSNYTRMGKSKKYGDDFMNSIDDGDVDDAHAYYNWYDFSLFKFFDGQFERWFKMPNRPLVSQEMSTGYPNNETGHPTRSYQLIHQNPMTLVGYKGYDFCDPNYFLKTQAFTTGELAEALRRSGPNTSGILHFSLHTWFKQTYDVKNIKPWPTYYALARALQPVLVSAEIWGRNLYGGTRLPVRFFVINDLEDGRALKPTLLSWKIVDANGTVLTSGQERVRSVAHYEHYAFEPQVQLPEVTGRQKVKLMLSLTEDGRQVSANEYELNISASMKDKIKSDTQMRIAVRGNAASLDYLGVDYKPLDVKQLKKTDLVVLSEVPVLTDAEVQALRAFVKSGRRVMLLNSKEVARQLYPEYVTDWIIPTEGDITYMEKDDDPLFDGIDDMELRYWNNNRAEMPRACNATLKTVRSPQVEELAGQMKIHAYIDGGKPEDRIRRIEQMRGFTLLRIHDGQGSALISTMCTEKAPTDPVAAHLLLNMINDKTK